MADISGLFKENKGQDEEEDEEEGEEQAGDLALEEMPCLAVGVELG